MKKLFYISTIILISLIFNGCELNEIFGPSKKEIELKQRELALKEQEIKFAQQLKEKDLDASLALKKNESEQKQILLTKQSDAKIANEKSMLDSQKEIELAKIKSSIEKEKIVYQNKEKDLTYDLKKQEILNSLCTQKYIIVFGSILALVLLVILFIYYNNRRKDKLRAYEDNLDKYFREKENQAKIEIASKILDTISSGKLNAEQENRLISTLSGDSKTSETTLLQEKTPINQIPKMEVLKNENDRGIKQ